MQENSCLKLPQMSNEHWCWNNEQNLNIDLNLDHQMSLSKSKCWYSNKCIHFLKRAVPLHTTHHLKWKILEMRQFQRRKILWAEDEGYVTFVLMTFGRNKFVLMKFVALVFVHSNSCFIITFVAKYNFCCIRTFGWEETKPSNFRQHPY